MIGAGEKAYYDNMTLLADFPRLADEGVRETSPATPNYNCIAWAAGDTSRWWEPDSWGDYYWPPGVPREMTVAAYAKAYETLGFEVCSDGSLEPDFEKVALYATGQEPMHAARQLPNGRWTSKLGPNVDIEHAVEGLAGGGYGDVVLFMKRSRS